MAQKRMFDKKVVGSDKFVDLPNSSKALYFMAGMEADDKGFFQPRKLQRMCGFSDDDFKILIAKRFFIAFDSGVMVVTDWNKNNWLDSRRITETEYVDELNLLKLVNQKYEFNLEIEPAKPMLSQYSIEENSIEENSIYNAEQNKQKNDGEKVLGDVKEIIDYLNLKTDSHYKHSTKSTVSKIKARLSEGFKVDDFKLVIDKKTNEWLGTEWENYLSPETLFGTKFEKYLNQKYFEKKEKQLTQREKDDLFLKKIKEELRDE